MKPTTTCALVTTADGFVRGSMYPEVGMVTRNGATVVKVNAKSTILRRDGQSDWRHDSGSLSISIAEARRFGFPKKHRSMPCSKCESSVMAGTSCKRCSVYIG